MRPLKPRSESGAMRRLAPAALLAAAFLALAAGVGDRVFRGDIFGPLLAVAKDPDQLSQREKDEIARRFYAHGPIVMEAVKLRDLNKAIATMNLTADQEQALREELASFVERDLPAATAAPVVRAILPASAPVAGAATAMAALPQAAPLPAPAPAAAPQPVSAGTTADPEFRLPLAWITLWDHKDEDGDIVRVVSSGYSRLIPILHQPVTLAIPVPPNGVVNVIGFKDGYGGITVGISSGAMPVVLPVLSEGQIVGVPVTIR